MPAPYDAPLEQIRTAIDQAARATGLAEIAAFADVMGETTESVLENGARFAREVLSPLNPLGDRTPSRCTPAGVVTPPGFPDAYRRFSADGWTALNVPAEHGGLGLPTVVAVATGEMWAAANMSFAMCAELAVGAIEALTSHARPHVRDEYLPRIVSGEWTTAMSLTEPQSGSDLSTVRTRAEPDGLAWRLFGRKIYISWGDHDLTENIVHLVLARTPDAPEGLRGISLFLVPKRWPAGGRLEANDIRAISLEHKMGIRASPTCAMVLGEHEGARGWLIGTRHEGLACMFTMMNHMRLGVGVHSLGVAERSLQLARLHAHDRLQGRNAKGAQRPIIEHADVRRMLLTMKALTQSARHLVYLAAATLDVSHLAADEATRAAALSRLSLLTPLVKAWVSDTAVEVASLGVQVHGGTGYVDDSEISQLYRDARIGPIFEGTNYIQAQDLLGRKVLRDSGAALASLLDDAQRAAQRLPDQLSTLREGVTTNCARMREAVAELQRVAPNDPELIGAVAHHFLQWLGVVVGGWQQSLAALDALSRSDAAAKATLDVAIFYAAHILPRGATHEAAISHGSAPVSNATLDSI